MKKELKEIDGLLKKRTKLAQQLADVNALTDEWLLEHGADMNDPLLAGSTMSGCMIYCEPCTAENDVREYIRKNIKDGVE